MKVESKLLIKVAFAILLVCGVEMKRVKSTKESRNEYPKELIKKAVTFCGIEEVSNDLILESSKENVGYLEKLMKIDINKESLSKDDRNELFGELSLEQLKELFRHLPEDTRRNNELFKDISYLLVLKKLEPYSPKEIETYLKEKTCLNLKNKIFAKHEGSEIQKKQKKPLS